MLESIPAELTIPAERLGAGTPFQVERVVDNTTLIRRMADDMIADFRAAKESGRDKVVFIIPVGPVGALELLAEHCNLTRLSLRDAVFINMDEYLQKDGVTFIDSQDSLSFRGYMKRQFWQRLKPELAPPPNQRIFPDPQDPSNVTRAIERYGGVDVCYGGVGITGHVAFNDPPAEHDSVSTAAFATLASRVVELSIETRVINSVTAVRGNIQRIPRFAVTVGMQEILAAQRVRLYLNRPWQSAIVRRLLHGPKLAAVPASLLQDHPDCRVVLTQEVAQLPEPALK